MALFGKKTDPSREAAAKPAVKAAAKASAKPSMKELYETKDGGSKAKAKGHKIALKAGSQSDRILVKPLITEKVTILNGLSKYVFAVAMTANKITVAKAIAELYGVKSLKVNIMKFEGKFKARGRIVGRRKDWKKAIVTLPKGETLDVYEGV
jgi:large subunit ribosomal protein L23